MNFKYLFPAVFKKKKGLKKEEKSQETARALSRVDVLRCPPSVDVLLHLLGGCLKKIQLDVLPRLMSCYISWEEENARAHSRVDV